MQPPPNQEHPQQQWQQPPMLMQQQWNPQQWNPQQPPFPQQQYQQPPSPRKPPNQYPPQMPPPKKRVIEMVFEIGCGLLIGDFLGFIALVLFGALVLGFSAVLDGGTSQVWDFIFLYFVMAAAISFVICWGLSLRREVENAYILENGDLVEGLVIKHQEGLADGPSFYLTYTYEYGGETYSKEQSVSKKTYREIPDGTRISVRCLPNNPERVRIDRNKNFWDMIKSPDC